MDKLLKNKWLIFVLLGDEYKDSLYDQESLKLIQTIKKIWMFKDDYALDDYLVIDRQKLQDLLEVVNRFEKNTENQQEQ